MSAACCSERATETAYDKAMADAPQLAAPAAAKRRKRQKSDTTTDTVSAFEQKAKANAEAVAANVAQRAPANARGRPEVAEATKKVMHGDYEHLDHTAMSNFTPGV